MVTVFFYLLIFTGSVERRILIVVPVDTLCRTSIISSSIVLLLNPFANLSLAPLFLFSIYGPDLGVWPDCWVSAEFLRAPIPRKGSGSTTTTTTTVTTAHVLIYDHTLLKGRQKIFMDCRQNFFCCKNNARFDSLVTSVDSNLGLRFKIQRNFPNPSITVVQCIVTRL